MKTAIVFALFVAVATAASITNSKEATVLRYESNNIGVEGYNYLVETSDGKSAQEQGQVKNIGSENEALEVRGQYAYTAPDGVVYTVTYVANEFGYQPSGDHIPRTR